MRVQTVPCQCGKKMIRRQAPSISPECFITESFHVIAERVDKVDLLTPEIWWCGGCKETENVDENQGEETAEGTWLSIWKAAQD